MKTKILAWALACLLPLNAIADKVEVTVNSTGVTEEYMHTEGFTPYGGYDTIQDAAKASALNTALAAINPGYDLSIQGNTEWKNITELKINGTINYADVVVLNWLNGWKTTREWHSHREGTGGKLRILDMSNMSFAIENPNLDLPTPFIKFPLFDITMPQGPIGAPTGFTYGDTSYGLFEVDGVSGWPIPTQTEEGLWQQFYHAIPSYAFKEYCTFDKVILNPNTERINYMGLKCECKQLFLTHSSAIEMPKNPFTSNHSSISGAVQEFFAPMSALDDYRNTNVSYTASGGRTITYKMGERLYPMLQYGKEWRTFSFDKDLDFTDIHGLYNEANRLEAYIVTGYDAESNTLTLEPAGKLPAGTGVLIRGTGVDGELYPIPATSEAAAPTVNLLVGNGYVEDESTKEEVPTHGINTTNYVLKDGEFRYCTGGILPNYKCYLSLPELIPVGDEAGAGEAKPFSFVIAERPATPSESETVTTIRQANGSITTDAAVYDLQGRKMSNSQPLTGGIYIKNGKKFVVR